MKRKAKNFTITELRKIIRLHKKGLSLSEIARNLGTSPQTIKNLLKEFYPKVVFDYEELTNKK